MRRRELRLTQYLKIPWHKLRPNDISLSVSIPPFTNPASSRQFYPEPNPLGPQAREWRSRGEPWQTRGFGALRQLERQNKARLLLYRTTVLRRASGCSFCFLPFRAAPAAYGSSQARGPIGALAPHLCHSHSNAGSKVSATCTTAHGNTGSLTHRARPGIKPESSWILVGFPTTEP